MNENIKNTSGFVGYEYKDITVSSDMESVYADSYSSFGWELENASAPFAGVRTITMKFKRDRKIRNKAEITRLQRQFDSLAAEIVSLERSKIIGASAIAYAIGVVGTAFMAGSVLSIAMDTVNIPLCIILAIPAFVG